MNSTVSLLCLGLLAFGSLAWAQDQPQVNSPEQVPVTEEGGMKSGQVHEDVVQAESEHGGEVMPSEGASQPVAAEASNAVETPVEGGHKQQPEASQTSGEAPSMPEQQQGQVAEEEAAVAPEPQVEPTAVEPVEAPAVESAQNEEKHPEPEEVKQQHEDEEEKAATEVAEPAKVREPVAEEEKPESAEKAPEDEAGEKKAEEKKEEEPKSGEEPKKDEKETDAPKVSSSELQSNSTTNSTVTEQEQKNAGAGSFWGKLVCLITRFYCPSSSLSGDDDDSKASNNSTETNSGQKHRGLRAGGMMIINVGDSSSGGEEDENEELASMEKDHPLSGEVQDGETKVNAKVKVNATMMESVVDENGKGQSNITQINAEMHN